jgi:hypothetical protein
MFKNFNGKYNYNDQRQADPMLTSSAITGGSLPLIAIDCSYQNEALKSGAVDVRIEFEAEENFPADMSAYCVMIHDVAKQYRPLTGSLQQI